MEFKNFFVQAIIYLLAAVISVPLAKRLGFGSVLGYLIAGIIIGPFALGMVGKNDHDVMHFSEFGIVMMLFLIGLELRPSLLWQLRAQILGMGFLQITASTAIFTGVFLMLGNAFHAALVIGIILSMSSTAIVMQIFTEKGWMLSPAGQSSFSVLLFQDIAVIPIMAILPMLAIGSASQVSDQGSSMQLQGWQQALLTLLFVATIVLAGRFLLRPIFRFIAQTNLREIFTATALLLVIANAMIMQTIGLSPALGTFLAGVVLAENEYRHELESDIEPFKGLLMGLFFISVGASINFNIILESPWTIASLVLMLMSVKFLILLGVASAFKINFKDNLLFSLSLAQGGEFCFVLLSYATQNNVLLSTVANQFVVVVAISMLLTPLVIIFYEKILDPYFTKFQKQKEYDSFPMQKNPVIIAGFGRFGQIIGRLLIANKIKATVLDLDSDNIELIRKFGLKVFYGDATRLDLLEAAGIQHAKLFINAIDDSEKALELAINVRKQYPHLKILSRVHGRTQAYEFLKENFDSIYRETFDSSLAMGLDALKFLGFTEQRAVRSVEVFRNYDNDSLQRLFKLYGHEKEYINEAKQSRKNLEEALKADQEDSERLNRE